MDTPTAIEISKFWFFIYTGAVFGVGLFIGIALMMFCKISANSERRMAKVLEKKTPIKANDVNNEIAF